jgi:hypothetical protein
MFQFITISPRRIEMMMNGKVCTNEVITKEVHQDWQEKRFVSIFDAHMNMADQRWKT